MRKILVATGILLLLLVIGTGILLSSGKVLGERHQDYPEAAFDYSSGSFAAYIDYSRERLRAARVDKPAPEVISHLLPFELEPPADCPRMPDGRYARGIVLIHGLLDSPYSMEPFGEFLQSQCFYVLGLLLPDHGSRPGDFLTTTWEKWRDATHFATRVLAGKTDQVYLSGHSDGGTLAILEAANNPAVAGLVLFAPALSITGTARFARFLTWLGKLFPAAAWLDVEPDAALYRYESFPFSAAAETWDLIKATREAITSHVLALPVLSVVSMEDATVGTSATLDFMQHNTNAVSRTLLYSQHAVTAKAHELVVSSSVPQQGVLSVSHLGLMTPPSHPYYGHDGAYRYCSHYGNATHPEYQQCKRGERTYYGEITAENLQQGVIERIAYNPFYAGMLAEVLGFFKTTGH